ncbi:cytochrome c oxidase assembly protein [Roseovarius spongiae]|uniref:Cytochrome c oxidase assembly protein n=1 Tax=Roseovarius spongiae TaxID=2320272 RepID=A0A3A8ASZ2_9RHOB|nr:cytochrome c oxidase assembly protein [Roseovarius spongiae]RKF12488.1 cytochrome c oxidase assembly protein [Roseovarius spongiae]
MTQKIKSLAIRAFVSGWLAVVLPRVAWAHGGRALDGSAVWAAWNPTLEVSGPLVLLGAIYLRGAVRRSGVRRTASIARHIVFATGLLAIFLSLQSPIDPMGERLFVAHQVQHLFLRMLGPMLIMLSRPAAIMAAGLPRIIRTGILSPLASSGLVGRTYRRLRQPWIATVLFVLSLYVWQVPSIHNAAIVNDVIHWAMHLTMLAAGLLFFAVIFTERDRPDEPSHFLRIIILFMTIISNILLGALTTFKTTVLYTAYDIEGRLYGIAPLADETGGGIVLWVPASMMGIVALLIVVYDWNRIEEKRIGRGLDRSGALLQTSDGTFRTRSGPDANVRNQRTGLLLALIVPTIIALIIGVASTVVVMV